MSSNSDEHRNLKKQLLHFGRPKLVRRAQKENVSIYGSKNDLISRIINSITTNKKNKDKKNKKKKKVNRKPLKMSDPIYMSDDNANKKHHKRKSIKLKASSTKKGDRVSKKSRSSISNTPKNSVNISDHSSPSKPERERKRKKSRKLKPKPRKKTDDDKNESMNKRKRKSINISGSKCDDDEKEEDVTKFLYEIYGMDERPFLNGKHCKIISIENNNEYRVSLINNGSQQIISKNNLSQITAKHKRKKPINIPSTTKDDRKSMDENETIKECMADIMSFEIEPNHIDIYAIGVFVNYQMILKLFIDDTMEYLFGTVYKDFKTECLTFLEEVYHEYNDKESHYKFIGSFVCYYHKCNDKQIIFLMDGNNNDIFQDNDGNMDDEKMPEIKELKISGMEVMDYCIINICNRYKSMLSDFDIIKQVWIEHDIYGFGEINKKEFNKFLCALTINTTIKSSSSTALFDKIDEDKIKAITFNQFTKYMMEKKKVLWDLLLELAGDYDLGINIKITIYQTMLSKIHKLILIMYEIYQLLLMEDINNMDDIYEHKMYEYIEFIKKSQRIIDKKMMHYKDKDDKKKRKSKFGAISKSNRNNRKYLEKSSKFIYDNLPQID